MKNFSRLIFLFHLLIPFLVIDAESDPEPVIIEGLIEEIQDDQDPDLSLSLRTGKQLQQSQARSSAKQQHPEELISGKKHSGLFFRFSAHFEELITSYIFGRQSIISYSPKVLCAVSGARPNSLVVTSFVVVTVGLARWR